MAIDRGSALARNFREGEGRKIQVEDGQKEENKGETTGKDEEWVQAETTWIIGTHLEKLKLDDHVLTSKHQTHNELATETNFFFRIEKRGC